MPIFKQALSVLLSFSVMFSVLGLDGCGKKPETTQTAATQPASQEQAPATTYAAPTPDQLYQLVAPIALFPDNLVAMVLAASTYPDQVSAAYQWLQQNASLKGQQLAEAANQQPWDASVKGLTAFSDVLSQMATNLSWTSALGDAYYNIPQSVMNAVQVMRQRAYQAGNLKTNQQQNVTVQNQAPGAAPPPEQAAGEEPQTTVVQAPPQTIIIQPAQPEIVYVPTYNPTVVYGAPVPVYPGYSTGAMVATSLLSFGVGIAVGAAISGGGCCGWGYNSWGCGWHNNTVVYNHNTYISTSNTFVNRNNYYGRNVNNVNVNNINRNNINTNNINRNNVNANNINRNNVNRNNVNANNRANNFNGSTPHFNQNLDQAKYRNPGAQAAVGQQRPGEGNLGQQRAGGNQPMNQQNRAAGNQPNFNQQNRAGANQAQAGGGNFNQNQRQAERGYGQQPAPNSGKSAFSNYSSGGNARTNSARGQQSLEGNRGGGGGAQNRGGGGQARGGGEGRRR